MSGEEIIIDGSFGEGGGQILRTSTGLAAALWQGTDGRELRVVNIRAGRPKPGLRVQHVAAVNAAAEVAAAGIEGARLDSRELSFRPAGSRAGTYRFEIPTAGSAMLVLQTILPALITADGDSEVLISGGTHNPFAPCFQYVRDVFCTLAEAANVSVALTLERVGFYPAGGGRIRCQVRGVGSPEHVGPLRLLTRGELRRIEALSAAADTLPEHIVQRQARRVQERLEGAGLPAEVQSARWPADCGGTVVFLRAVFSHGLAGFSALGRRGKPAERVADEAVDELLAFLDADGAVDPHAADQLITILALCPRASQLTTTRITNHLLTNAEVIRQITGRQVTVEGELDRPGKVILDRTP
ncbi:MAG: RNA 3'-terminal-phosphate cyclase [Planctomycetales bacterium 4484_123]|nr:MAG: RNA 3'-terminal-phosphate cyclase [Planctomycetales bacterium 4484_123]